MPVRVLIVHEALGSGARPDEADVLEQARLVRGHLEAAGHEVETVAATLDLRPVAQAATQAEVVFNLVESLGGRGALIHLVPAMLEAMGVRMTGCPWRALADTSHKPTAKRILRGAGIPTPAWVEESDPVPRKGRWIVKAAWEHASVGLGPESVMDAAEADLGGALERWRERHGSPALAERYIEGREFNLSVLEVNGAARVLPVAEIDFVNWSADRPRIVDYEAKWEPGSMAWHSTPRRFDFAPQDAPTLEHLRGLASRCWDLFGLRGWARVDFRVDAEGRAWVLEVNANPCLSEDAGFMAAARQGGMGAGEVIEALLQGAVREGKR